MRRHNALLHLLAIALLFPPLPTVTKSATHLVLDSSPSKKIYEINKRCSTTHQVVITKVVLTDDETIVYLRYTRNPKGWGYVFPNEPENVMLYPPGHKNAFYIENVYNGKKFSLLKIEKGPIYPDFVKMEREQTQDFELILERIDRSMKRFHLIEGEEGSWKFWNVKLEPPDPDFTDYSTRVHIKNELEAMFDKKLPPKGMSIEIIDELNVLDNYTLLRISALPLRLEHAHLPSPITSGIFAYNGEHLFYLNHANDNLAKILSQEEIVNSNTVRPRDIARLVISGKISRRQIKNKIINNISDILAYEKPIFIKGRKIPSGYEVDKGKIEKYKDVISAPHWEDKGQTRNLVFYCLTGWMHRVGVLSKFTVVFDKSSSNFTLQKETLEQEIFKKFPRILY